MAAPFYLQAPLLHKSHLLGQTNFTNSTLRSNPTSQKNPSKKVTTAKFNIFEIMGGRGLCNGEVGIQKELENLTQKEAASSAPTISSSAPPADEDEEEEEEKAIVNVKDDAFEKELLGLTGGFPGGEKGLIKFIEENQPPKKES